MKEMDTKKLMATFAILMIVLGVAGFAYAHWEKIVTIDGTVTTGKLHVKPSLFATLSQDKPVATLDYDVYPEQNYMNISLENVYPCLWVCGWIDLENDGTIPVNLVEVNVTLPKGMRYEYEWNETGSRWDFRIFMLAPPQPAMPQPPPELLIATGYVTLRFPDNFPQIDPGHTAYIDFCLHFEEALPQNATFTFTITFEFWNWNEAP